MSKFRGFIAIEVDAFPKILEFEKRIKDTGAIVKLVEPENVHITLKFLGNVDECQIDEIEKIMKESVESLDPFNIRIKSSGAFPNDEYIRIIWIGIEDSDELRTIATKLDDYLSQIGFKKEKRSFSAHLTIGRVKAAKNKKQLLETIMSYKDIDFGEVHVDSIKLKKSDLTQKGPVYSTIREVRL